MQDSNISKCGNLNGWITVCKRTTEEFIASAQKVHGDRYDYSNTVYDGAKYKITVMCKDHGDFIQRASHHLSGQGCPKCFFEHQTWTTHKFIQKSKEIHKDRYNYSVSEYVGANEKLIIICNDHGKFSQTPSRHVGGSHCPICAANHRNISRTHSTQNFIQRATHIHGDRYDYADSEYVGAKRLIAIRCRIHGIFNQTPSNHTNILNPTNCPKCKGRVSNKSQAWLTSIEIPDDAAHREVCGLIKGTKITVDGYDPITKTVYEFQGDYWHGNPKIYNPLDINPSTGMTYGELYEKTLEKKRAFLDAEFKYIEMWESEWISKQEPSG